MPGVNGFGWTFLHLPPFPLGRGPAPLPEVFIKFSKSLITQKTVGTEATGKPISAIFFQTGTASRMGSEYGLSRQAEKE